MALPGMAPPGMAPRGDLVAGINRLVNLLDDWAARSGSIAGRADLRDRAGV
jgi:hypothetical protein